MALANVEIQRAIQERRVVIDPEPAPAPGVAKTPYDTTAVDLRLGNEIVILESDQPVGVDLRRGKFAQLSDKYSRRLTITDEQPYHLKRDVFVLAKTKEWVEFPYRDDGKSLCGRVEGKSSFARCGMLVHFTAPTIHNGFEGNITLEIINLGPLDILLFPEMYICQLILEEVTAVPVPKESQFHRQTRPGGQARRSSPKKPR